jgi:poly-gamma-glutamate synthesis protein (capsule biosynthesis protein)
MKCLFVGDVCPTAANAQLFAAGDVEALFTDTRSLFAGNDVNMVNLECALTDAEAQIEKIGPALKAPPATADTLRTLGVTHCALSNNHFFDFGRAGAADSLAALERAGLAVTGFGRDLADARRDLVIEQDGERLCVIAVCEHEYSYALEDRAGTRPFDPFETPLDVRAAKEKYDRVVVLYHGGKEQCRYPSPRLRAACHAMAKSGADLILCQHSHCIGCYEQIADCHILYGQGNFHFTKPDYRDKPGWNDCLAAHYNTRTGALSFTPVVAGAYSIRLAGEREGKEILDAFAARNAQLQDGTWLNGWRAFCECKRESYTRAIREACVPEFGEEGVEKFAHYLDCEAHTDVWRELFKTNNHRNER